MFHHKKPQPFSFAGWRSLRERIDLRLSADDPRLWRRAAVPLILLTLVTLACGSFAPRPTAVPRPTAPPTQASTQVEASEPAATATPLLPTSVPTRAAPTATFTPTPIAGTVIIVGQPARIVAEQGLNARKSASVKDDRVGRFAPGTRVSVLEGPVDADGYRWWRVGTNQLSGWVAEGDGSELWLSPQLGDKRPVNRAVRLNDEVVVTVGAEGFLKVRTGPGLNAPVEHQLLYDTQLSVIEGPVDADGYRWWKVSGGGTITGWAAEGDGADQWLTPLE